MLIDVIIVAVNEDCFALLSLAVDVPRAGLEPAQPFLVKGF